MFMTDCDLVYGRNTSTQSNNTAVIVPKADSESSEEKGTGIETAAKAAKAFLGAHVAVAKFAGGAVSKLSKKAVDYAKSDDAAKKMDFVKDKAGSAFSGLKDKAAALAAERKKSSDENISTANEGDTEENYNTSSDETVYQSDEEYAYKTRDSITDDNTSYKRRINTNAQPAPMSSSPVYNAKTYAYEKEKKSEIIYHILIGIISVLLVVIGVLFGILLMKFKSTTQTTNSNVSDATIEPYVQENATKETIATTKPEKPTVSSDEINNAAKQALSDFMKNNAVQSPKYSLYDVNGDGISELFITYMAISGDSNYILYYYDASKFSESEQFWGGLSICPDNRYLKETNYGGAEVYKYYQLNEENQLSKFDEIYSSPDGKYYRNGQEISNSEYYAAIYYYNDMSWIDIYDNSYSFSDLIDISAYVQNNTDSSDPYADIKQEILNSVDNEDYRGKNSHIENAPSDMVFYNYENRSSLSITNLTIYEGPDTNYPQISAYVSDAYIVGENNNWYYIQWYEGTGRFSHLCYGYLSKTGQIKKYTTYDTSAAGSDFSFNLDAYSRKVITEKDPLNLRAAPSTSADIIIQMPKGSDILLWGVNAEWAYVSYTENGITYYGYANRKFIGVS